MTKETMTTRPPHSRKAETLAERVEALGAVCTHFFAQIERTAATPNFNLSRKPRGAQQLGQDYQANRYKSGKDRLLRFPAPPV
ncbi:hypothetical protein LTR28_007598 [Elasticomyces elasticus]|nr:hypothetical protein LTR28_007598 [Elasticomyces elasticus]